MVCVDSRAECTGARRIRRRYGGSLDTCPREVRRLDRVAHAALASRRYGRCLDSADTIRPTQPKSGAVHVVTGDEADLEALTRHEWTGTTDAPSVYARAQWRSHIAWIHVVVLDAPPRKGET
jgi:hypothetical protein